MTIIESRLSILDSLVLRSGSHPENDEGQMCVAEAVAWIAGEPWSDHPQCASPAIAAFLRRWNDSVDDETRQLLKPYIVKLVGSRGSDEVERKRAWLATDWMVHRHLPLWLRAAGMNEQADAVEALPPITGYDVYCENLSFFRSLQSATWELREKVWTPWREAFRAKLVEELKASGIADAAAVAAAVADAVAAAVADAAAVAVAVAADAAADAAAGSTRWWTVRTAVYNAIKDKVRTAVEEKHGDLLASTRQSVLELVDAMLAIAD